MSNSVFTQSDEQRIAELETRLATAEGLLRRLDPSLFGPEPAPEPVPEPTVPFTADADLVAKLKALLGI